MEVMQKHQSMKSHGNNRCHHASSPEIDLLVLMPYRTQRRAAAFSSFSELLIEHALVNSTYLATHQKLGWFHFQKSVKNNQTIKNCNEQD